MLRSIPAFSLLSLFVVTSSSAYEAGDSVVIIHDTYLMVGENRVDHVYPGLCLKVNAINDQWLWLSNGIPGWLDSGHVVPLDRGIDVLSEMIRQNPTSAKLYSGRGFVWREKKEYDNAINDYNQAIRLDPQSAFYNNRALVLFLKQEYDKAVLDYGECIRLERGSLKKARAYSNRGRAWSAMKEWDKARDDFNEAIRLDSKYVPPIVRRGYVWLAKKEYEAAIKDFDDALQKDPVEADALSGRGLAWKAKEEYGKAIADFDTAVRINPKLSDAYFNRGACRSSNGDFDGAIADYEEAIHADPNSYRAYVSEAELLASCCTEELRDGKKAVQYATKACEMTEFKEAKMIQVLAMAFAECGDFAKAVEWQTKAIELASEASRPEYQSRLDLYNAGKPYREEPKK